MQIILDRGCPNQTVSEVIIPKDADLKQIDVRSELPSIFARTHHASGATPAGGAQATQQYLRESAVRIGDDECGSLGNW